MRLTAWQLWRLTGGRHLLESPGKTLLLILILATGVAVYLSVRLANRAALAGFAHFTDTLTGQSDWIAQPAGGDLPVSVLPEMTEALAGLGALLVPVLETTAAPLAVPVSPASAPAPAPSSPPAPAPSAAPEPTFGGRSYTVLGLDLVALGNLPWLLRQPGDFFSQPGETADRAGDYWNRLRQGFQVWVPAGFPYPPGGTVDLVFADQPVRLTIAGRIPQDPEGPPQPENLLVMDLPALAALTGRAGRLDRVEVVLEPGPTLESRRRAVAERLTSLAGAENPRWFVTTPGARRETVATMTAAFQLNLTVLSLIALLVGLYLVFQALDGAVVRRRLEIGILRSLGVDAPTLRGIWLIEALLLGAAGGLLGLLLGWLGAQGAVQAVGRTVNALYFATTARQAALLPDEALAAFALSLAAGLVAGWGPARAAALTEPAQLMLRHGPPAPPAWIFRSLWPALTLAAAGALLLLLPPLRLPGGGGFPLGGYFAAFFWIAAAGALAPRFLPLFTRLLYPLSHTFLTLRLALGPLRRLTSRHCLAVAALVAAIGMTASMAIMVASFDRTVRTWIVQTLQADLYISSAGSQAGSSRNRISSAAVARLAAHPSVVASATYSAHPLEIDGVSFFLGRLDLAAALARDSFTFLTPAPDLAALTSVPGRPLPALASEPLAQRFRLRPGDTFTVPTAAGPQTVRIAAVYADYGSERGNLMVAEIPTAAWFAEPGVTSVSLDLAPAADPEAVRAELLRALPGLSIYSNRGLKTEVLRIFRQTFGITYALEAIGLAVALGGLVLTLTSILLDRRDILTTQRALGLTRHEMAAATAVEGLAVALGALLSGLLLSLALGRLLIQVINKQSFGWTLASATPWDQLTALALALLLAGAAAGFAVGWWGSSLPAEQEE